jgi:hypothetical protein
MLNEEKNIKVQDLMLGRLARALIRTFHVPAYDGMLLAACP